MQALNATVRPIELGVSYADSCGGHGDRCGSQKCGNTKCGNGNRCGSNK